MPRKIFADAAEEKEIAEHGGDKPGKGDRSQRGPERQSGVRAVVQRDDAVGIAGNSEEGGLPKLSAPPYPQIRQSSNAMKTQLKK